MIDTIRMLSQQIPLELFVFLGSILEEIIAPIPTPIIMSAAGALAESRRYTNFDILLLAVYGSLGKTLASYVIYVIADKTEDVFVHRFGKFFNITQHHIDKMRPVLNTRWFAIVFLLSRIIPAGPTVLVSIVSGILQVDIKLFIVLTFVGVIVRNFFYLWLGIIGLDTIGTAYDQYMNQQTLLWGVLLGSALTVCVVIGVWWFKYRRGAYTSDKPSR